VKYAVACFFNVEDLRVERLPMQTSDVHASEAVDIQALGAQDDDCSCYGGQVRRRFVLRTEPRVAALPFFLSEQEIEQLLELLSVQPSEDIVGSSSGFPGSTVTLRVIEARETEVALTWPSPCFNKPFQLIEYGPIF
jgi:hypothetical protein